jgi:single-stranded-DNA-specific exonuclease
MKHWLEPQEISPPPELQDSIGGHPLVAQTLSLRGIADPDAARAFLDPAFYPPAPPTDLPDLAKAADRIEQAIECGETILVWGDFDVDGQTSTTLLVEALRDLGAKVKYHIPVRASEGHGIKVEILRDLPGFQNLEGLGLILTCDTGIAAHEAVDFAQARGIDVIITDHHELPETLPEAYAVINPHRLPAGHTLGTLPGVGVAFKLMEELIDRRPETENRDPSPILRLSSDKYLDLVALGIVADVAEQTGDTRYLLQRGLQVLRNTQRLGLQTLFEIAEIIPTQLDEGQIGFGIGPRLNALGRLSDANSVVEFFTTTDPGRARILALQLDGLNERRKLLTEQVYQGALAQIDRDPKLLDYATLVLAHPGWPNGVIGIVASRLVEKFGLPTILLNAPEGELARGSARSVEGLHITEAIAAQADLLTGFGGHAGAAGMSLPAENIPEFRVNLSRTIRGMLPPEGLLPTLKIDAFLPLAEISLELVDDLERLAPFGVGNPPLNLASRNLKLVSATLIGRSQEHLRLVVEDEIGVTQDVLWWRGVGETLPDENTRFDLAYRASANTFRGERRLQLEWVDFRPAEGQVIEVATEAPSLEIVDYRNEPHPLPLLNALRTNGEIQVWAEGEDKAKVSGLDRGQLFPEKSLAIWTTPAGYWELQATIEQVAPQTVYLFARDPGMDQPQDFLARLVGLVKHAIHQKNGETTLAELAAATAQREGTVQMGLFWLEAKGFIKGQGTGDRGQGTGDSEEEEPKIVQLSPGTGEESTELAEIMAELKAMLEETAAYRKYFSRADKDTLITA